MIKQKKKKIVLLFFLIIFAAVYFVFMQAAHLYYAEMFTAAFRGGNIAFMDIIIPRNTVIEYEGKDGVISDKYKNLRPNVIKAINDPNIYVPDGIKRYNHIVSSQEVELDPYIYYKTEDTDTHHETYISIKTGINYSRAKRITCNDAMFKYIFFGKRDELDKEINEIYNEIYKQEETTWQSQ